MDMQALNITFNENSAQNGNGGALDIENAVMKITGAMSVQDNYAMQNGGAIYVRNGVIEINSIGNGVFFVNNFMNRTESPVSNDIYLDNNSEALLNAKDNKIVLKSGIAGLRNSHITKTGADNLEIGGHIEFYGTLNVIEGQVQLIAPNAKIGQINIEKDAALTAILNNTAIAGDAVINGTYQMQINLSEKQYSMLSISAGIDAMASGKLIIDENTSIFSILSYGILQEKETSYTALYADGGIEGEFASIEHSNPSIKYNLQYTNNEVILNIRQASLVEQELAYNANNLASYFTKAANDYDNESEAFQPLIAKAFDIPENREARQDFFNKLSGNIIANALIDSADNRNAEIVFQRENSDLFTDRNNQSFWIRGSFYHKKVNKDDNSISNFELDEVSALLGTDIIQNRNMLLGIYADITDTKFKEADDKANASGFGFGLYMFAPINNAMEIYLKSAVSFKYQKFDIERNFIIDEDKYAPQSSFDTKSVKAALDLEKIFKFNKIDITPFLGLWAGIAFNDEIKEENSQTALLIKSGSNSRVYLPFGVNFDFRANNIWTLRAKLFAKPILAGEYGQFNAVFNESANKEEMNIRGIKESFTYGIGLSADYHISDAFAFNMNASMANTEYAIGIGITYKVATGRAKKQEYEYEYED
jgi:predicted outer membrane repeat protein